ncbi:MAG: hypothetical protein IJH76_01885 [Clostridia bacterium]|nr:hypothetical protein [Clostridia bacterium]
MVGDIDILKAILILNSGKECNKNESVIAYNIIKEKSLLKDNDSLDDVESNIEDEQK